MKEILSNLFVQLKVNHVIVLFANDRYFLLIYNEFVVHVRINLLNVNVLDRVELKVLRLHREFHLQVYHDVDVDQLFDHLYQLFQVVE